MSGYATNQDLTAWSAHNFGFADHSTITEKLGEPMSYKLPLP
jgi:hypothetical protein